VPVVLSEVYDYRNQHGEGLRLVGLEDVQEIVIFEEAHGAVSNLQVDTTDALYNALEQLRDQGFDLLDLADFEDLLQLSQEEGLLDAVSEGPVLEQTLKKRNRKSPVFCQEKHRASQ